ncbi:hypothetical protein ACFWPU_39175 [Streptomyces sp. NPDC058471]|uniref:hypothetical protein n=1 Tax=Streptomyces sp. NPDC058471 TaxID=3346516 RepID=UPI0036587141
MDDLNALYQAAGGDADFSYTHLIRDATLSGFTVSKSNLSAWRHTNPPLKQQHVEYVMTKLIPDLKERAARRSPGHVQISETSWAARLAAAQKVSRSGLGGRGPRIGAASPGRLLGGASPALLDVLPVDFVGREEELDSLERFVTAPSDSPAYLWWQAGPWAGKTALLSWFTARRLPAGVDVAHYVIASRLGTDRRDGFVRTIRDQLAAAADGRRRPALNLKQPDLGPMYEAAARACASRHRRLILVVDGLDEDAEAGPDETGIAGLLPKDPPCGMRVIVAGRPHPRMPRKLAADHPLREPAIVRPLTDSPAARIIRDTALTELRALLDDPSLGQHLLGLLVAARGALTGADLAELTERTPHEVRDILSGVTGRSLAPVRTDLLPLHVRTEAEAEAGRQTFVLAHQELHATAQEALGRRFLAARTTALHNWARQYSDAGWPHDTPNYLLTGYTRLLHEHGDTERLTALALDARRQLRLIQRSGPDVALLHLDLAAPPRTDQVPPLSTAAAIAASREMLLPHMQPLPTAVAQTIARLGDAPRARALTSTSGRAVDRTLNLAGVARVLHAMEDEQAAATAQAASRWARRALQEAGRFGDSADEAESAAGQAALALLETAQQPDHGRTDGASPHVRPAAGGDSARQRLFEDGLALLRSTQGTGTARTEIWAQAIHLLTANHPEQAGALLDTLEEQAEDLACEEPADTTSAAGAIQLWQTAASAAPDRANRLVDHILTHAQEVWNEAPTLENISILAAATICAASSHPTQAQRLANTACRHLDHVLGPDAAPLTPPDAFHVEFGFRHTITLLSQALAEVGTPTEQITRVLELAAAVVPPEPQDQQQLSRTVDKLPTEAVRLAEEALRLAGQAASHEAERCLEQALALLPAGIPGSGRAPVWLPDLASALIRSDAAANARPLIDLVQHPADRVRLHAALALAYRDTHQPTAARRHAHEAARAATTDQNWPYAAQALASAGEIQAAADLVMRHPQPHSVAARAAWRKTDRAARIAVAAELTAHAPHMAGELLLPLLKRLEASSRTIRSNGLLSSLAELLPASAHLPPEPRQLLENVMEQARDQSSRSSPHSWRPEDVLVHAFLRIEAGERPDLQLTWLTHDMASRGPEHFPTSALAVLHAALGDSRTALQVARQPTDPLLQATALTAVASHLVLLPARPHPMAGPTAQIHFTRAIQHLALNTSLSAPDHEACAKALHHALTTPSWHQAIPILPKLAPEAIRAIHDIATAHLHTPLTPPSH